jgi:hypothetical protein
MVNTHLLALVFAPRYGARVPGYYNYPPMQQVGHWPFVLAAFWILLPCLALVCWRWSARKRLMVFSWTALATTFLFSSKPVFETIMLVPRIFLTGLDRNLYAIGRGPLNTQSREILAYLCISFLVILLASFVITAIRAPKMRTSWLRVMLGLFVVFAGLTLNGLQAAY